MSSQRERAATTAAHQPDKETLVHALDLCAHMDPLVWAFIAALPPPSLVPLPNAEYLIRQGLGVRVGKWFAISPEGVNRIGIRPGRSWLRALAIAPNRGMLAHLLREGIITNEGGFPALTPFGAIVQVQVLEGQAYTATRSDLRDGNSSSNC